MLLGIAIILLGNLLVSLEGYVIGPMVSFVGIVAVFYGFSKE